MKFIKCVHDPQDLISHIGDPYFSICDEKYDPIFLHPNHPFTLRIVDCEDNLYIDITGATAEDTRIIAQKLCDLLNQEYKPFPGLYKGRKLEWLSVDC